MSEKPTEDKDDAKTNAKSAKKSSKEPSTRPGRKFGQKRRAISGINTAITIAATLGIAVALNAVSSQYFGRIDLTENRIYTLSDASKQAVSDLPEPVHIKAFISPDLPVPMHTLAQNVADTLDEYAAASGGNLSFELISPNDGDDIEEDARGFGCEKVAIGQRSEDEVSLRAVFKCVAFSMGEKLEVVGDLAGSPGGGIANFEYDFTKALLNLQNTRSRQIGFVSGFGGPGDDPQFLASLRPAFKQLYGDLIEIKEVDLAGDLERVPPDIQTLVILNAEEKFSDEAIFAIDQFLQRGGSVGWFQSSTAPDWELAQQMMQQYPGQQIPPVRRAIDPGLNELFGSYGLDIRSDIVLDPARGHAALAMTPQGLAEVSQPATFLMDDLDRELPFMRNFGVLALPAPSSVIVNGRATMNEELKVHKIIQTGDEALRRPEPPQLFNFDTLAQRDSSEKAGKWTLAAAIEGKLPGFYDEHPVPDSRKDVARAQQDEGAPPKPARVLVVGSGDFFQAVPEVGYDQELAALGGQFLLGSLEWLTQDTALSDIRQKAMPRLLGEVPRETQRSIQFLNIAMVPALFGLLGVIMMSRRRRRREALEKRYQI